MVLQHYLRLLVHYRWWIARLVVGVTGVVLIGSLVQLAVLPIYTATASVAVIPTEAEYTFGRDSAGAGPRGTARGLTATYVEYLKSRPVVEAAYEKISAKLAPSGASAPSAGWFAGVVKGTMKSLRRMYRTLDSGKYVALTPREAGLQNLMDAIDLQTVADSYILRIEVSLDDPKTAAEAANALAGAYVQRISEQMATSVGQIGGFLREQISVREAEIKALQAREDKLKSGVGSASLEEERNSLARAREVERQKLIDAQNELGAAEAQINVLQNQDLAVSGRSLAELAEARAAAIARRDAATQNIRLRQRTIQDLGVTLEALKQKEEPLLSVQRRLEVVKEELGQLYARALTTEMSQSSALTQVRVIDPAVVPIYPSSPRVVKNTAIGLVVALIVAAMLLVVIDTVSDSVKSPADIERIAPDRNLGVLSRRVVPDGKEPVGPARARLRHRLVGIGRRLERGLAIVRAFEAPSIQVTGFTDRNHLARAAAALSAALAVGGRRVTCRLPDGARKPVLLETVAGEYLRFSEEALGDGPSRIVRVQCVAPVSADLDLAEASRRSPAMVCVVPVGEVSEGDVRNFRDRALAAGLSAFSLIVLES